MRWVIVVTLLLGAVALAASAAIMDGAWWTRHVVVPACYLPPPPFIGPAFRWGLGVAALALVATAFRVRRTTAAGASRIGLAVLAALGISELGLRALDRPEPRTHHPRIEFLMGGFDLRTGWSFTPKKVVRFGAPEGGPVIDYFVDAQGDRAPSTEFVERPDAPTLLVTGESMAVGHGLEWPQTFAAQAGARLGLQVVNVAEGGYGSDQALLRAQDALQRLHHPVALVSTVLPVQLHRNLADTRPHFELRDGSLMLVPAFAPRIRLRELIADDLQILPEWRLQKSLQLTRAILAATAQAARDRGARPLFVGVVFGPAPDLLRDMLEGLPHRIVALDPARIMRWDGHPDPQGARQIADAIVQYVNSP